MDNKSDDTVGSGEEAYLSDDFDEIDELQNTLLPRVMDLMSKMNDKNDQNVDDHCLRFLHNFQATETRFIQNQVKFSKLNDIDNRYIQKRSAIEDDHDVIELDEIVNNKESENPLLPQMVSLISKMAINNKPEVGDPCFQYLNFQEPQTDFFQTKAESSSQALVRDQIAKLRDIRDGYTQKRSEIEDDREIYEFEEIIDLIDTVIESKNQHLVKKYKPYNTLVPALSKRLLNLSKLFQEFSQFELELLIVKLVEKVIELRDSTQKLESQVSEMEIEKDAFNWKLQVLNHALFQSNVSQNGSTNSAFTKLTDLMEYNNRSDNLLIQEQKQAIRQLTTSVNSSGSGRQMRSKVTIENKKLIIQQNKQF